MPELSSLDGILCLETSMELMAEAENADFSFVDSMLLDSDEFDCGEESPYV